MIGAWKSVRAMLKFLTTCVAGLVLWIGLVSVAHADGKAKVIKDPHAGVLAESNFPSASQCAGCHSQIYKEWASSNHAYASISPMFHKFEQAITELT
jgi:hypothetical protein